MCFVRECWTGFLAIFTALSLSQRSGILSSFTPKSKRVCFIYRIWAQHAPAAIYSASAVDKATEFCFLLDQETRERPSKWQPPEVLLRSTRLPAKSESEYPKRSKLAPLGYHKPMLGVCLRYRRILFIAERCDSFGLARKRAHKHTLNIISGLDAVR